MAKKKANKKVVRKRRKAQPQDQPQRPKDQDQPQREFDLPRMSNLRLSQLPGPLTFRLAGGRLKVEE